MWETEPPHVIYFTRDSSFLQAETGYFCLGGVLDLPSTISSGSASLCCTLDGSKTWVGSRAGCWSWREKTPFFLSDRFSPWKTIISSWVIHIIHSLSSTAASTPGARTGWDKELKIIKRHEEHSAHSTEFCGIASELSLLKSVSFMQTKLLPTYKETLNSQSV